METLKVNDDDITAFSDTKVFAVRGGVILFDIGLNCFEIISSCHASFSVGLIGLVSTIGHKGR